LSKYQKVAYYPGCALEGTGHAYNASTKAVGKALGLELDEVKDWNCCGAMEVKNVDPKVQTYLSSRVLSIAAHEMKAQVVMAPCNGCNHNLKKAEHDLAHDAASRETVERISKKAGHETYQAGSLETIHALDWIKDGVGEDELKKRLKNSLKGLKVANYYGCMYTRPRHIFPEKDQGPGSESTCERPRLRRRQHRRLDCDADRFRVVFGRQFGGWQFVWRLRLDVIPERRRRFWRWPHRGPALTPTVVLKVRHESEPGVT
jgi:hypothetical protein